MKIFYYSSTLSNFLTASKKPLGFVPTMGALHEGHMALVRQAREVASEVLVSIFVNPRQFNNPDDLRKYPRSLSEDLALLQEAGADTVFIPNANDIFPEGYISPHTDISPLDNRYEGAFRPGHFEGVVSVLSRLFALIHPDHAFFGLKDLQQCLVIEKLIASGFPGTVQHNCEIIRESSGLAMSSRNRRLSEAGLRSAAQISTALFALKSHAQNFHAEKPKCIDLLESTGVLTEYLDLVQLPDLSKVEAGSEGSGRRAIIFAGYVEEVRLIDNVLL